MTTSAQATVLILYSLAVGAFTGVIYDIFRILRIALPERIRGKRAETVIVFVHDVLFWLVVSIVFVIFIYYVNKGMTRLVMISASCLGFLVYYHTAGRIVIFFSASIIGFIRYIFNVIYKIFINPLIFLKTRVIIITRKFFEARINRRTLKKALRLAGKGYGLR